MGIENSGPALLVATYKLSKNEKLLIEFPKIKRRQLRSSKWFSGARVLPEAPTVLGYMYYNKVMKFLRNRSGTRPTSNCNKVGVFCARRVTRRGARGVLGRISDFFFFFSFLFGNASLTFGIIL